MVYFSWSQNTQNVAKEICQQINGDIFKLSPLIPYTDDYDRLLKIALVEQRDKVRPLILDKIKDINKYDIIYLGYPNWYDDMPMIIYTFLESYDLSNKIIIPFCTSTGSSFADSIYTIKALKRNARVLNGLRIWEAKSTQSCKTISRHLYLLRLI